MGKTPLYLIAGPCVIEEEYATLSIARKLRDITAQYDEVQFIFKASYDKANRTSVNSYRGPGLTQGLHILQKIKDELGVSVLSDVHTPQEVEKAAQVLDVLQIPAFLCRQTDLLVEAGRTGKLINIKKGQFVAPQDMAYAVAKVESTGNHRIWLTERGTCLGYHNLVVDFRSFSIMRETGYPVIFDVTHSVQTPSQGGMSSGRRDYVPPLARAAAAYGVDGFFFEVHPDPERALCDGPNSLYLDDIHPLLAKLMQIRAAC